MTAVFTDFLILSDKERSKKDSVMQRIEVMIHFVKPFSG